jgi:hypothetical protein
MNAYQPSLVKLLQKLLVIFALSKEHVLEPIWVAFLEAIDKREIQECGSLNLILSKFREASMYREISIARQETKMSAKPLLKIGKVEEEDGYCLIKLNAFNFDERRSNLCGATLKVPGRESGAARAHFNSKGTSLRRSNKLILDM